MSIKVDNNRTKICLRSWKGMWETVYHKITVSEFQHMNKILIKNLVVEYNCVKTREGEQNLALDSIC